VTSPMQYWKLNLTAMLEDDNVKDTAKCIPNEHTKGRVCFDRIGVPVMQHTIFGGLGCVEGTKSKPCYPCPLTATGLMLSFLLNNNAYSYDNCQ